MIRNDSIPLDRFHYYSFRADPVHLLSPGVELVIDRSCGYSMLLACNRMHDQVLAACTFRTEELSVLLLLCEYWPSMVSYDLLATAQHPAPTTLITGAQIEDARDAGTLEQLLAPLKTQIEGYRSRLQELGLDLAAVDGYGYRLVACKGEVRP
jgi:hypothetical protein